MLLWCHLTAAVLVSRGLPNEGKVEASAGPHFFYKAVTEDTNQKIGF